MVTLFLDLDGVLHPDDVYLTPQGIELRSAGHELFEQAPRLVTAALEPYKKVRVVLSTRWVAGIGYRATLEQLPIAVRNRVVGATTFGIDPMVWRKQSRYEQIAGYVARKHIRRWVALDDDARGWPPEQRGRLVLTNGATGMTALEACDLGARLRALS